MSIDNFSLPLFFFFFFLMILCSFPLYFSCPCVLLYNVGLFKKANALNRNEGKYEVAREFTKCHFQLI